MAFVDKEQYNGVATEYLSYADLPQTGLEDQLVSAGLGDCTDYKVLDLGGGSGSHARQALYAGANHVDVVDVSEQMLQAGRDVEEKNGRDVIEFHRADISKALEDQLGSLEQQSYDLVMIIWAFDHARTIQELEGMWQNASTYLKPGGRFVGLRVANPRSEGVQSGKYGATFKNVEEIPDGVKYEVVILTNPPFSFEATSMETSYSGTFEVPEKFGFSDLQLVPAENTEVVKEDPEYWKVFLQDPHFVAFTGKKK